MARKLQGMSFVLAGLLLYSLVPYLNSLSTSWNRLFLISVCILGFILIIVGIKYLTITKERKSTPKREIKRCPSCKTTAKWNNPHFCSACGTNLDPRCSKCNISLRNGDSFCYQCGQNVEKNTPPILSPVSQSSIPTTVKVSTLCPYCNATINHQDAFCGACGKSFDSMTTDQTMQQ
ncbi:MAG TPA: zinc ribbon domain-containing protein [Ktedonobacteraceae bacterium]|jgi:predicted amidophosphoribosyltransferase